ncbi:Hypothetical predicted protein [Pelobates cultripes]|uniref:Uncharacterized protein n=1 Tax=Pelobates cultripes TaxID=61616 RepID=A0AAD1W5X0_PELCU|nr:Hypothetical predicted protein [Pelobates cultripes]
MCGHIDIMCAPRDEDVWVEKQQHQTTPMWPCHFLPEQRRRAPTPHQDMHRLLRLTGLVLTGVIDVLGPAAFDPELSRHGPPLDLRTGLCKSRNGGLDLLVLHGDTSVSVL